MIRPIRSNPRVPSYKVVAKTNVEQIAWFQAEVAKFREQIRLANKMGEQNWAAWARQ